MKASQIGVIVLALSGLISFAANAADAEAGKAKSAICAACHGADGNSSNPMWPSLAGQHASYTYKQLIDFQAGRRINAPMSGLEAGLRDDAMKIVTQLQAFKQGARANDSGKMMRNLVGRMSEMEMKAVAAYVAGIQ